MDMLVQPYALTGEEGAGLWFLGIPTRVLATSEQTGGNFCLLEQVIPPGLASPWHVHHAEAEAFYVAEGQMTFLCGGRRIEAGPGSFVYGPRDIPHGFRVEGTQPARLLLLCAPAGFEQFVLDMSEPAPPSGPPDIQKMIATAAKYSIEILGLLPE